MTTYITPWLSSKNVHLGQNTTYIVYTFGLGTFLSSFPIGSKLNEKFGGKIILLCGSVILLIGTFMTIYVQNLW